MPSTETVWQYVATYAPQSVPDGQQEVLRYTRLAQKHPGCITASASQDLESGQFRLYQEWSGKEQFMLWLKETSHLEGEGLSRSLFESTPFRAPDVESRPHHIWGRAERKQLTKANPQLFFLSIENRTKHALFNNTTDSQYEVTMRFPKQVMEPCEGVSVSGEHFKTLVFPGQTVPFVEGKWNGGYALSYSFGPVTDPKYLQDSAKELAEKVRKEVDRFKEFLQMHAVNPDEPGLMLDDARRESFEDKVLSICLQKAGQKDAPKFVDLTWPPNQSSICRPQEGKAPPRAWMRPHEFLPAALKDKYDLMVADQSGTQVEPADIDQGALGDCWFMAAIAACAEMPDELVRPIFNNYFEMKRDHQAYKDMHQRELDAGFFKIRLAKHGWWKWHVVDTFLPVQPMKCPGGPCFAKNREQPHEMWVAMLEKVYAKCHGSYNAISGGDPAVALSDLTGFPAVTFDWPARGKATPEGATALFKKVLQHDLSDRMIWVTTPGEDHSELSGDGRKGGTQQQVYDDVGLVTGHAYTVLKAIEVQDRQDPKNTHRLVQIRNPWGGEKEWNMDWSDYNPADGRQSLWLRHPEVAQAIAERWPNDYPSGAGGSENPGTGTVLEKKQDGSHWMSWTDCLWWFDGGGVCLRQKGWQDVRFKTGFSDGHPDHFFKITPSSSCKCVCFVVQHDRRGLAKDDTRVDWCALRVEVLTPGAKKPMYDTVAHSNDGVFMYSQQVVAFNVTGDDHEREEPFELEGGKEYYVMVRQHPSEQKQHVRNRDGIVVAIQTSDGNRSGPRSQQEPIRGFQAFSTTQKVREATKYVGYYGLSDEGAVEDADIPCQVTYRGSTNTHCNPAELRGR
eukprot:TRINITY_DN251_c1_g1_i1.p1 TRINITY_DN251_c1_g1~~TRINITY_DN251_c1_g1_i1.p1  ORF type:complete len:846 (+),score=284.38 TRINITY_DN251_c1_g1_i1:70-2607(+)